MGPAREFEGTQRFRVLRCLGRGGSGVVYEAFDGVRRERVALKCLTRLDATALFQIKREFRVLAELRHPNLVRLHELFADDDAFFTMELVQGVEFLDYVWRTDHETESEPPSTFASGARLKVTARRGPRRKGQRVEVDLERLRAVLLQLVSALEHVHRAGKLHRDVKPSNILVTTTGMVKLLDFGLASDQARPYGEASETDSVAGTPAYMAPEQAAGEPLGPAADWYAVGSIFYRALTGRLPFEGSPMEILAHKLQREAMPPSAVARGVPPELDALVADLLRMDPQSRPGAGEIRARLRSGPQGKVASVPPSVRPFRPRAEAPPLVGREAVLAALHRAHDAARRGSTALVLLEGTSGMGKSAVLDRFAAQLSEAPSVVVLRGRCFERESLPYKGMDAVIDALSSYLLELSPEEQLAVAPRPCGALTRLFPVLARVPGLQASARAAPDHGDDQKARRRAFEALRELVGRLGDRRDVVLIVDDLQWSDVDSVALIRSLLQGVDAPPMLLVLAYRSENLSDSKALANLLSRPTELLSAGPLERVCVGPLDATDGARLARQVLPAPFDDEHLARRVAEEAGGSPYFIGELCRWIVARGGVGTPLGVGEVRLERVVAERVRDLSAGARALLQAVAVAGRPVPLRTVHRASEVPPEQRHRALEELEERCLLRSLGSREQDLVECFHDRVREAVMTQLSDAERRRCHRGIAIAMVEAGDADPEALSVHFLAAEDVEQGNHYALRAAERAASALAFDRAARLLQGVIERLPPEDPRRADLHVRRAHALASSGRGGEAAEAYLAAREHTTGAERLALARRAGEELLFSGHIDRGWDVLAAVLSEFGLGFAKSRLRAVLVLLLLRLVLRLRGLRFRARPAADLSQREATRLDVCLSAATGLSMADNILAAPFSTLHLLQSLRAGERKRICRALLLELSFMATEGAPARSRVETYLCIARRLAHEVAQPDTDALLLCAEGLAAHFRGDFAEGLDLMQRGLRLYQDEAVAAAASIRSVVGDNFSMRWEVNTFSYFLSSALVQLGRLRDLDAMVSRFLQDAESRGDLYAWTVMRMGDPAVATLARGQVHEARERVDEGLQRWSSRSFQVQHWWTLQAHLLADLYEGEPERALQRVQQAWKPLSRSLLLRVQYLRVRARAHQARALLAAAGATARERNERLARTRALARSILREKLPWTSAEAYLLLGCGHLLTQDEDRARASFTTALAGFERAAMGLHAAVVRRRLGALLGGETGRAMVATADAWLTAEGVRDPVRVTAMLAPAPQRSIL